MTDTEKWTPGPWAWFGNPTGNSMYLATTHSGRRYVMGFERWGVRGAQPTFQVDSRMIKAEKLVTFEVGTGKTVGVNAGKKEPSVYRYDINGIAHPDARLIAAAPELYEALERLCAALIHDHNRDIQYWVDARAALSKARGEQP